MSRVCVSDANFLQLGNCTRERIFRRHSMKSVSYCIGEILHGYSRSLQVRKIPNMEDQPDKSPLDHDSKSRKSKLIIIVNVLRLAFDAVAACTKGSIPKTCLFPIVGAALPPFAVV